MAETFGSPDWCMWCKSDDMSERRSYDFVEKDGGAAEQMYVCSEQCERQLADAAAMVRRGRKWFFGGLIGSLVAGLVGTILMVAVCPHFLVIAGAGAAFLGLVLLRFPLVTPQTLLMFGFRKGLSIGRIGGVAMILLGVATAVAAFFIEIKPAG